MNKLQKMILGVLPDEWAKSLEAESRKWYLVCGCGSATSVWDAGGIRAKAAGKSRQLAKCPKCKKLKMMKVEKREA
jgi:hypothetical protein